MIRLSCDRKGDDPFLIGKNAEHPIDHESIVDCQNLLSLERDGFLGPGGIDVNGRKTYDEIASARAGKVLPEFSELFDNCRAIYTRLEMIPEFKFKSGGPVVWGSGIVNDAHPPRTNTPGCCCEGLEATRMAPLRREVLIYLIEIL